MSINLYSSGDHRSHVNGYTNRIILKDAAQRFVCEAQKMFGKNKKIYFCGIDGSSLALATACLLNSKHQNIRMKSLTHPVYKHDLDDHKVFIFVDDYLNFGGTLAEAMEKCAKFDAAFFIAAKDFGFGTWDKDATGYDFPIVVLK